MKRAVLTVVLAAAVGVLGVQQASARVLGPHGEGAPRFEQLDEATKAKFDKFRVDTLDLRKQMAMKRAEERAYIKSETPNMEAVRKTAGELFDLRTAMHEKAQAAGLNVLPKRDGKDDKITQEHAKLDKFLAETQDLHRQMSIKMAEKRALMHSRNADAGAVAKIAGELFDLRNTIHEKAKAAGISMPFHGMGKGKMGPPSRQFFHHGGFGMMGCPGPQDVDMFGLMMPMDDEDTI